MRTSRRRVIVLPRVGNNNGSPPWRMFRRIRRRKSSVLPRPAAHRLVRRIPGSQLSAAIISLARASSSSVNCSKSLTRDTSRGALLVGSTRSTPDSASVATAGSSMPDASPGGMLTLGVPNRRCSPRALENRPWTTRQGAGARRRGRLRQRAPCPEDGESSATAARSRSPLGVRRRRARVRE